MQCLEERTLWELAEGGLPSEKREEAVRHVASCEECRRRLQGEVRLSRALGVFWEAVHEQCPDMATLYDYGHDRLPEATRQSVAEHVELCARCRQTLQYGVETAREVLEEGWESEPAEPGYLGIAQGLVSSLIQQEWPKLAGSFEALWDAAKRVGVKDISVEAMGMWREQLSATMAVAGVPEIEYVVACRVAVVGLRVCRAVAEGEEQRETEAIRARVKAEAKRVNLPRAVVPKVAEALAVGLAEAD